MEKIYLDYAASSLKHFNIYQEVIKKLEGEYANPSSSHSLGKKNYRLLTTAREKIANSINTKKENIIFTSGGTEANNMVFNHIKTIYNSGDIIISNIEHPSVNEYVNILKNDGFNIIKIKVNKNGSIDIKELENKITKNTILISVMFANNEIGVINPIEEIGEIAKKHNILFHSDIVQAYCKTDIDMEKLNIDFASVSSHKIGATNNFGFLYTKTKITPLIIGGGQENGMRSGTSDIFSALVLSECIDITKNSMKHIKEMKDYFLKKLSSENVSFLINGDVTKSLPNIVNIYFVNIQSQRLLSYLDINNIFVSAGSACKSGSIRESKIILNMFNDIKRAGRSIRFSFGFDTTKEKIDIVIEKIATLENKILNRG